MTHYDYAAFEPSTILHHAPISYNINRSSPLKLGSLLYREYAMW